MRNNTIDGHDFIKLMWEEGIDFDTIDVPIEYSKDIFDFPDDLVLISIPRVGLTVGYCWEDPSSESGWVFDTDDITIWQFDEFYTYPDVSTAEDLVKVILDIIELDS